MLNVQGFRCHSLVVVFTKHFFLQTFSCLCNHVILIYHSKHKHWFATQIILLLCCKIRWIWWQNCHHFWVNSTFKLDGVSNGKRWCFLSLNSCHFCLIWCHPWVIRSASSRNAQCAHKHVIILFFVLTYPVFPISSRSSILSSTVI